MVRIILFQIRTFEKIIAMNNISDPMGVAILEFFRTGNPEVINVISDIAEPDIIPVEYLFRTFEEMPITEQTALQEAAGTILDAGAAAGAHSLWLQENGKEVTALDTSELSVEVMKQRGIRKVIHGDFFTLPEDTKYDTLLFLMNGVGLAGTLENLPFFLKKCRSLLSAGGKVLLDSSDLSYMFDDGDILPEHYYGEVNYQMEYKGVQSKPFKWLFLDFYTLSKYAEKEGGRCRLLTEGDHFDYLAEITW
jgi:hypothetical protein